MSHLFVFLPDLERVARDGTDAECRAAFSRLVGALATVRRFDVTHYESGCDCCSGHTEVTDERYGEYVMAGDLGEALAIGAGRDVGDQPG